MGGGFMSSDPSPGQRAAAAGVQRQAQNAVREWVTSAGVHGSARRGWVVPLAATAAVAAAACVPVVWPLLAAAGAGAAATALQAALSQVGGVGGGLLSEAVIRAWDRLRSRGQADAGQAELRDALATELEAGLTLDTRAAAALRDEVAGVLRSVDAVQVALTATVEESAAGVREVLVRGCVNWVRSSPSSTGCWMRLTSSWPSLPRMWPRPRPPPVRSPTTSSRPWWSWPAAAGSTRCVPLPGRSARPAGSGWPVAG